MAKSKYSEVVKKLAPLEVPRSERVEAIREKYVGLDSTDLAKAYVAARKVKDLRDAEAKSANETIDAIVSLLVPTFEEANITTIKLDTGQSVGVGLLPRATVEDRDVFREWCKKNGYERELNLAWQTTDTITKELLLQGLPEPDGVKAYVISRLRLGKA